MPNYIGQCATNSAKNTWGGVIYSCITNSYDNIPQVLTINPKWDYVLFTDNEQLIAKKIIGVWNIHPLIFNKLNPVKNSRYHKINNQKLFPEYDYSLYIDGNVIINSSKVYKKLDAFIKNNIEIAIPYHPKRNCAYIEAEYIKYRKIDYEETINKEITFLKSENYPENNGLFENNIIFRNHHNQNLNKAMELWWKMVETYSKRDQLSGLYSLWKYNIKVTPFYSLRGAHRYNKNFLFVYKKTHNQDKIEKNKKIDFNFITSNNENTGSTRIRVNKISKWLNQQGYLSEINSYKEANIYIFQKSNPKYLKPIFNEALKQKKFIVFDIDDYHKKSYHYFIKRANLVIVCSSFLKEKYKNLNKNILVLDGALDVKDENITLKSYNLVNPKLGWFGNTTNLPALEKTKVNNVTKITQNGDIEWHLDTIDKNLQQFDLILLPQDKTPNGLAKGNNRMLKTIYLGRPALVSDLDAYVDLAKKINYPKEFILSPQDDWNSRIEQIKSGDIQFNFDFEKSRKLIKEYYSIDAIANQWLTAIHNISPKKSLFRDIIKKFSKKYNILNSTNSD